jgi:hypothetical protein
VLSTATLRSTVWSTTCGHYIISLTRCNNKQSLYYFTAISLYMFRMPFASIIRST